MYLNYDLNIHYKNLVKEILSVLTKCIQKVTSYESDIILYKRNKSVEIIAEILQKLDKFRKKCHLKINEGEQFFFESLFNELKQESLIKQHYIQLSDYQKFVDEFNQYHKTGKKKINLIQAFLPEEKNQQKKLGKFLYQETKISKNKLGQFFGEEDEFYQETFKYFCDQENFQNIDLDTSFRRMLSRYDLIGEGQKIDRMIQQFAKKYHNDNKEKISEECAYGFSYLMIMLQSEHHNPLVPEKMTYSQFEKLGKDIPEFSKYLTTKDLKKYFQSISMYSMADYNSYEDKTFSQQNFIDNFIQNFKQNKQKENPQQNLEFQNENEKMIVIIDIFNNLLSSNLIISFSMSCEFAQNIENVKKLVNVMKIMLNIFTAQNDEEKIEQILMAILRLSGLDTLGRNLLQKNIIIIKMLFEYLQESKLILSEIVQLQISKIINNSLIYYTWKDEKNYLYFQNKEILQQIDLKSNFKKYLFNQSNQDQLTFLNTLQQFEKIIVQNGKEFKYLLARKFIIEILFELGQELSSSLKFENFLIIFEFFLKLTQEIIIEEEQQKIKNLNKNIEEIPDLETSKFIFNKIEQMSIEVMQKNDQNIYFLKMIEKLSLQLDGQQLILCYQSLSNIVVQKFFKNHWQNIINQILNILNKKKETLQQDNDLKFIKTILKIIRHYIESVEKIDQKNKNNVIKIINLLLENNQQAYGIIFLILKQIIELLNDKVNTSQDITEDIFPLLHIFSSFRFLSCRNLEVYNEAQKNLNHSIKKILRNKNFNQEHKEIIFKSFILPINEDINLSLSSKNIKNDFNLFTESSSYLIDIVLSMQNENHIKKILLINKENLDLDKVNQNKVYKIELQFFQLFEIIKSLEKIPDTLLEQIFNQIEQILKYSSLYCKEFKTVNFETFKNLNEQNFDLQVLPIQFQDKIEFFKNFFENLINSKQNLNNNKQFINSVKKLIYKQNGFYNNLSLISLKLLHVFIIKGKERFDSKKIQILLKWLKQQKQILVQNIKIIQEQYPQSFLLQLFFKQVFTISFMEYIEFLMDQILNKKESKIFENQLKQSIVLQEELDLIKQKILNTSDDYKLYIEFYYQNQKKETFYMIMNELLIPLILEQKIDMKKHQKLIFEYLLTVNQKQCKMCIDCMFCQNNQEKITQEKHIENLKNLIFNQLIQKKFIRKLLIKHVNNQQ